MESSFLLPYIGSQIKMRLLNMGPRVSVVDPRGKRRRADRRGRLNWKSNSLDVPVKRLWRYPGQMLALMWFLGGLCVSKKELWVGVTIIFHPQEFAEQTHSQSGCLLF